MLRTRLKVGRGWGLLLSLALALLLTLIHSFDRTMSSWAPALGEKTPVTLRVPYGPRLVQDGNTGRTDLQYEHRRIVVPQGTTLQPDSEAHYTAWIYETARRPPSLARLVGMFSTFLILGLALTAYLRRFSQNRLRRLRPQLGILTGVLILALLAKTLLLFTSLSDFLIPIAIVPLWVAKSFDRRTALMVGVGLAFIVASMAGFDLVLLGVMLARATSATLFLTDKKRARQLVTAGSLAGLSGAFLLLAITVTFEGSFDVLFNLDPLSQSSLAMCLLGGFTEGLIAAALHVPAAHLLGHVSRERLLELSDLEQPLLQELAREAPGTYEHSRAMANLAEQAAAAIGADALLTRVGAYYHDIGKSAQSKYFVENLAPEDCSPHEKLEADVSANAIMAHVVTGTQMLREGHVPEAVVEFAYTHHGTQVVEFFWNKCLEQGNPRRLTEDDFRYPGMKPETKETAILMLVDSIEAASRTVDPPARAQFEAMIQQVIFTKLRQGQLDESGLDMKDLRVLTQRMADTLVNMHHHRIKYQWQRRRAEEFGVPAQAVQAGAPGLSLVHGGGEAPEATGRRSSVRTGSGVGSEPSRARGRGTDPES